MLDRFYILKGDLKDIRHYLLENGFDELKTIPDGESGAVVIGTTNKTFWAIKASEIETTIGLIITLEQDFSDTINLDEFKQLFNTTK